MRLQKIYEIADMVAPFALSEEYINKFGEHDNSGIQLDCGKDITGVLFSLDLSARVVEEAKKVGANCIFTHHPAIWTPVMKLAPNEGADLIVTCLQEGISVISAHLNLDAAPEGIDEQLMHGLGGKSALATMEQLTGGAYGRVYEVEKASLAAFVENAKKNFGAERVISYGEKPVKRVASFCGGGFTESAVSFALQNGADTLVSSDGKHHLILEAVEKGLNVVLLTHYAAENYGFVRFAENMKKLLKGTPCAVFTDERFR